MLENKKILITGGAGSLGKALTKELSVNNQIVVYSRNEESQFEMREKFGTKNIEYKIGDIRDKYSLKLALTGCDIVIHAAAMKDLIMCEAQPTQANYNNIEGSRNLIDAILNSDVTTAVAVSTDKAASPSNVYGMTKYIMEKLFIEASKYSDKKFCCTRFGNIIDSKGSLPSFWKKNPDLDVKLTHPDMERFYFKLKDAVKTVVDAIELAESGEIYVPKMKKAKIIDVLKVIFKKDEFEIIGLFPGEKIYEDLIGAHESYFTIDKGDYYVIDSDKKNENPIQPYSTRNAEQYTINEVRQLLYD